MPLYALIASLYELFSDHLITRRIHQRLTYERYSLHGTVCEGHHFRINLNAFTLTFLLATGARSPAPLPPGY